VVVSCVVLDIGGVLEVTPSTGWGPRWEAEVGLAPGTVNARLEDVWRAGSVGTMSEEDVVAEVAARLGLAPEQLDRFWAHL
jgi:hypothetical protein